MIVLPFRVVVLSRNAENLKKCVASLRKNEPDLFPFGVYVVDDGARPGAPSLPVVWMDGVRPFVFARNANLGILAAAPHDVVLMNDDAILENEGGLSALSRVARGITEAAVVSAGIHGSGGTSTQQWVGSPDPRREPRTLAFICVYLKRDALDWIGLLDERFVGYGYDDNDLCRRARGDGMTLWASDRCEVEHGSSPSTFRTKDDIHEMAKQNRALYVAKWKEEP